jgi:hypothetical protein
MYILEVKMKRIGVLILSLIFTISLVIGVIHMISKDSEAVICPKCHLVWDTVDKIFYCVGSEINCCCDLPEEPTQ